MLDAALDRLFAGLLEIAREKPGPSSASGFGSHFVGAEVPDSARVLALTRKVAALVDNHRQDALVFENL